MQPPGSHPQVPLCHRGLSLEAVQRILAARHAFVQQQRRQDRAVAGSVWKRFDPASVSAVLYQSLCTAQAPAGREGLEATSVDAALCQAYTEAIKGASVRFAVLPAGSGAPC